MHEYPLIVLDAPVRIQQPVDNDTFRVIHIAEDPVELTVQAFIDGGPQRVWISVFTPETYYADWTDEDVIAAVKLWAETTFPPAS